MWSSNVPSMNYPDFSSNRPDLVTDSMRRGLWMTHEILNNPEELADLNRPCITAIHWLG